MVIYIGGYSLRAPKAKNPREFYENLRDGIDMTSPCDDRYPKGHLGLPPRGGILSDIDRFDQEFFRFNTKQTEKMDVAIRLLLEVAHEALMDAQIAISSIRGSQTGVYVGHCFSDYLNRACHDPKLNGYEVVNGAHAMAANKISYHYDLKGPSLAIDTACSSSLVALNQACSDIQMGVIDRAIVCGVSLTLDPHKHAAFNAFKMLSPDGKCFTFDTRANGYCRSEGIVAVILESDRVRSSGLARILGTSVNSDGFKETGITYPSAQNQAANARRAFQQNSVDPESIVYVEAHGTGTVVGDREELNGLSSVFYGHEENKDEVGGRQIPIGSVKSSMGHAEGASGLISLVKCLLMYESRQLFPNLNFESTLHKPLLDGRFNVVTQNQPWEPGNVCISNYGFGGTNAFLILGYGDTFALKENGLHEMRDIQFSFGNFSGGVEAPGFDGWFRQQVLLGNDTGFSHRMSVPRRQCSNLCFVYGGQGSQWLKMGKKLYQESNMFKDTIHRLAESVKKLNKDLDLVSLYEDGTLWFNKNFSVLGIISYQIATTNILADMGIHPDFFLGHSLGEISAGYVSGCQTEEETIQIAYVRSQMSTLIKDGFVLQTERQDIDESGISFWYSSTTSAWSFYFVDAAAESAARQVMGPKDTLLDMRGKMVAVGLDAKSIQDALDELQLKQTVIACYNSPRAQTVSGPIVEVCALKAHLEKSFTDFNWQELETDNVAYHAPYLSVMSDFVLKQLDGVLKDAVRPFDEKRWLSTSQSGGTEKVDSHYHLGNIVNPVYFQQAIESLPPNTIVLEVGSSGSLLGQVKRVRRDIEVVGFVRRNKPETEEYYMAPQAAKHLLWSQGYMQAFSSSVLDRICCPQRTVQIEGRWPDIWDHSKSQRIFTHSDFEYALSDIGGNKRGMKSIEYLLDDEHAFLMDHYINGRSLFPATGHIFTLWLAKGLETGIRFTDFEIKSAIMMDGVEKLIFFVAELGDKLAVLYEGEIVAQASFSLVANLERNVPRKGKDDENLASVPQRQLYLFMKQFGYEYKDDFQLMREAQVTKKGLHRVKGATLRPAKHLIAFLDNMLQLLLIRDVEHMQLPTLIREIVLHPQAVQEFMTPSWITKGSKFVKSECVTIRSLHTTQASERVPSLLTHRQSVFVPLGESFHVDEFNDSVIEETRRYITSSIMKHSLECPSLFEGRPWLNKVVKHASDAMKTLNPSGNIHVNEDMYKASLHYRFHVDLFNDFTSLIENTYLTISSHPEHDLVYEKNPIFCSSQRELAEHLGIVCKEWHGTHLHVLECGAGSCGLTRRAVPLLESQLEQYVCSDVSAIRLGTLDGHPKISTMRHDLNKEVDGQKHHLIIANNAVHTVRSIKDTLEHLRDALVENGMILLEEFIGDACIYLWGLDEFAWETPSDSRSFALWMTPGEWKDAIDMVGGLELLCCSKTSFRINLLLRKKSDQMDDGVGQEKTTSSWCDIPTSLNSENTVFRSLGADGFLKSLRNEIGPDVSVRSLVELDETQPEEHLRLPLMFNHVRGGKLGSLVNIPFQPQTETSNNLSQDNFALSIHRPGDLSSLFWKQVPDGEEYFVQVRYSSLNFRDIMIAFGKLRVERLILGLEFSGIDKESGKAVMGIGGDNSIGSRVKPAICWEIPDYMSMEEAATVPVAYATSLFALFAKANLKKGQSVLIHAGSGAVGHSAIHLCQKRGIEVFTTCSDKKRDYMKKIFGLDDDHIGNSRDTSFCELVLEVTDGEGVDCVMNSLSGDCLHASLQCVKDYGHFCEIGKYDLQNNTAVGLKALERNVSYHAIDLRTTFDDKVRCEDIRSLLSESLAAQEVVPLPVTVYDAEEVEQAFRFVSAGKHIGKVLLNMGEFCPKEILPQFSTSGTHIITGGLGGFGLELMRWLLANGAKKVVATSRSENRSGWQLFRLGKLQECYGDDAIEISCLNVVDMEECKCLLEGPGGGPAELKGVWHVAMVLCDTFFQNMTEEKWEMVNNVKVKGLQHLDALTCKSGYELDAFVTFSSIASLFGSVGQSNYCHANSACDMIIEQRKVRGIKPAGLAVQWGLIDNVGFIAKNEIEGDDGIEFNTTSISPQNVGDSLESLHSLLAVGGTISSYCAASNVKESEENTVVTMDTVLTKVSQVLGGSPSDFDADVALDRYGVDSLSRMEIVNWINKNVSKKVTVAFMTADLTLRQVYDYIEKNAECTGM